MILRRIPRGSSALALAPWAAGLALVAFALGANVGRPSGIDALTFGGAGLDADQDGIHDHLEDVLGLNPDKRDTDRDDWSDSEELARGSNPKDANETPKVSKVDVGVHGYSHDGVFHLVVTVYTKGGLMTGHEFQLGVAYRGVPFILPPSAYLPVTDIRTTHGRNLTDVVHVLDVHLPEHLIELLHNLSFFATVVPADSLTPTDADVLNLVMSQGVPHQVSPVAPTGGFGPGTLGSRGGSFYTPLTPGANLPPQSAQDGKVCVQSSRVIGVGGGGTQLQIEEATCEDGDGTCSSGCTASVGGTVTVIDPLILIGG